jgi:SAM-dependent methyltransferase
MCNRTGLDFGRRMITKAMVAGLDVIEVGSHDVNGSLRSTIEALGPHRYVGVDLTPGPGVDEIVDAEDVIERFAPESFDLVVSTEMIEHTRAWQSVVHNLKGVLRPGGHLLVTTRSPGFPFHAWPYDFWRYEPDDMRAIFGDMDIITIESDSASPGVFVLARRPVEYEERTPALALTSIITGRREAAVTDRQVALFRTRYRIARRLDLPTRRKQVGSGRKRARRSMIRVRNRTWQALPADLRVRIKRMAGR